LPFGGNSFTEALSDGLNISLESAEELKMVAGLNPDKNEGRTFLILQKEISKIIEEASRTLEYFRGKYQKEIKEIIIAGGSAVLPGLADYLSQNLSLKVALGDPWIKINTDILKIKKDTINPLLYSAAVGSALRGLMENPRESGINFIPKGRVN